MLDKVLIIGLGLIGGSLARSLKQNGLCREVVGHGHRDQSLKKGVELGVIDRFSMDLDEALRGVDVVVVATPVLVAQDNLRELVSRVGPDTVITDVPLLGFWRSNSTPPRRPKWYRSCHCSLPSVNTASSSSDPLKASEAMKSPPSEACCCPTTKPPASIVKAEKEPSTCRL